jgi:hypothetical protein
MVEKLKNALLKNMKNVTKHVLTLHPSHVYHKRETGVWSPHTS